MNYKKNKKALMLPGPRSTNEIFVTDNSKGAFINAEKEEPDYSIDYFKQIVDFFENGKESAMRKWVAVTDRFPDKLKKYNCLMDGKQVVLWLDKSNKIIADEYFNVIPKEKWQSIKWEDKLTKTKL